MEEHDFDSRVVELVRLHHYGSKLENPNSELEKMACILSWADSWAEGLESPEFLYDEELPVMKDYSPLESIFSQVRLQHRVSYDQSMHYYLPVAWEESYLKSDKDLPSSIEQKFMIDEQWNNLSKDLLSMKYCSPNNLLIILKKHTANIACQYKAKNVQNNLSFFQHHKTTAAIANVLYKYLKFSNDLNSDSDFNKTLKKLYANKEIFTLIAGDLSGIQEFVYTTGSHKALRNIRGRSFFLELTIEAVITEIIEKLNLDRSNVIYNAGGGFLILAPTIPDIREKIEDITINFNSQLLQEYGQTIYLATASTYLYPIELHKSLDQIQEELHSYLSKAKRKKWYWKLNEIFSTPSKIKSNFKNSCQVCNKDAESVICSSCNKLIELGHELDNVKAIYASKDCPRSAKWVMKLGNYYYYTGYQDSKNVDYQYILNDDNTIQCINTVELYFKSRISEKEFDRLVEKSPGIQKLGAVRMDVDYLGQIFKNGLYEVNLANISELSDRLNYFFKKRLADLFDRQETKILQKGNEEQFNVNLIYAGGDDLFLVGTWDSSLEAAWCIRKWFKSYVGNNPSLTISGGWIMCDHKLPLYKMAEMSGEAEVLSKQRRNSLGLVLENINFKSGISWCEVDELWELVKDLNSCRANRALIKKIVNLLTTFSKDEEKKWQLPQLYYTICRSGIEQDTAVKLLNRIAKDENGSKVKLLLVAAHLIELASRGGEHFE